MGDLGSCVLDTKLASSNYVSTRKLGASGICGIRACPRLVVDETLLAPSCRVPLRRQQQMCTGSFPAICVPFFGAQSAVQYGTIRLYAGRNLYRQSLGLGLAGITPVSFCSLLAW